MKEGWKYKKLGEVGTVIGGSTPKTDVPEFWDGDFAWITPAELDGSKYVNSTSRTITKDAISKTNLTLLPVGTVLLSSRAPIGKVCITKIPMYCNQGFKNIVCSDELNNEFLYWWLKGKTEYLNSLGVGATFKEISKRIVEQITIPVPPIETQSHIVSELDLLQSIIDKQQAQLKELDNLAQSIFYDMFGTTITEKGWKIKKLGEVGRFQRGGGFLKTDFVEGGFPCIHYGQIHTKFGSFIYSHLTSISEELALSKSRIAHTGDVIIAITSEDVEGSCKSTAWLGNYDIAVGAHTAIYSHTLNPIYVSFYFDSAYFHQAKTRYAHGFKVVEIKPDDIAKIDICIPPLSLQQSFAEKIEAIEKQKANIKKSIEETQKLFDYTMDKYFG